MTLSHRLASLALSGTLVGCTLAPIALGGCFSTAPAENHAMRNGYNYLGERFVHGGGQEVHEAIAGLRNDGRFTSIMIVVENAPVQMDRIVITFGDGQRQEVPSRVTFGPDSTTREVPLEGGARVIRRVDFVFNNFPGNGQAKVELWAR